MLVVVGEVVGHADGARVHVAAAELLGRRLLARGRLDQRRPAEEDRALVAHDDALVAHRRDVGAARRARCPSRRRSAGCRARTSAPGCRRCARSARGPGKTSDCMRQERAARVDQVDAGQAVLQRDLLRAQVLLDRHRVVGAALDRGVVGDDHALAPVHHADAGDEPGAPGASSSYRPCAASATAPEMGVPGSSRRRRARGRTACRVSRGAPALPRRRPGACFQAFAPAPRPASSDGGRFPGTPRTGCGPASGEWPYRAMITRPSKARSMIIAMRLVARSVLLQIGLEPLE